MSLLFLLLAGSLQLARAAEINDLYQATISVSSRDNESVKTQAFSAAMRKVLVKLTGRTDTLERPEIIRAIANVTPFVESSVYRSIPTPVEGQGTPGIALEVTFYRNQIQNLLDSAAIPLWPSNRPDTLLWVVEQDEAGKRSLVGSTDSALVSSLQALAAERGLPLISPILDLQDQLALRPETLWNFDLEAIRQASARYQADSILAVRVVHLFGEQAIAKAVYLFRSQIVEAELVESELQPFLEASISMAARELAGNYAILQSGINDSSRVNFTVERIKSIADYAGMLRYLQSLAVIKSVQVLSVNEDSVELELATGGQLRQLIESIALDRKMLPLVEPLRENQLVRLRYQWQSQ